MTSLIITAIGVAIVLLIFRATRGRAPWEPFPESVEILDRIDAEKKLAAHKDKEN